MTTYGKDFSKIKNFKLFKKYLGIPLFAFLINYQSIFSGTKLLGDLGDARLSVTIYEHWWRVFRGFENFNSTLFFYPAKETLGLTDSFFFPGTMHSFFRLFGFSIINSWYFANLILLFLGIVGITRLGSRFINNDIALLGFVLVSSISYPFVTQLGHIQTLGYLLAFWIIDWIFLLKIGSKAQQKRAKHCLLIAFPLLALSAWYPFALLIFLLCLWYGIEALPAIQIWDWSSSTDCANIPWLHPRAVAAYPVRLWVLLLPA